MTTFRLTDTHLMLLRHMCVGWNDCEFGAPCIDPKRPYGNSDVVKDLAAMIGLVPDDFTDGEPSYREDTEKWLCRLHRETRQALQIVLTTGAFEAGTYVRGDDLRWRKATRLEAPDA